MKKFILPILAIILIIAVACQQSQNKSIAGAEGSMKKATGTNDATVDSVGRDINSLDSANNDLSADNLSDVDSGLSDVQNI